MICMTEEVAPLQTEYVYLIGSKDSPIVKIGRSIDVPGRLAAIQYMSPLKLTVLWQTEGGAELESALHRQFKAFRSHGEWFELPGGDAADQVVSALAEMAAEAQMRLAEQREKRKVRKLRKVWRAPRRRPGRQKVDLASWLANQTPENSALITEAMSRAKLAQETIERIEAASLKYRRIRSEAIGRLAELGVSQSEIARQLDMSVPRIHEIAHTARREAQSAP